MLEDGVLGRRSSVRLGRCRYGSSDDNGLRKINLGRYAEVILQDF